MSNEYSLPPEVIKLEHTCAKWTAAFAKQLPEEIRSIAFCAPASFREPEIDDVWHPIVAMNSLLKFLIQYPPALCRSFAGGIRRFMFGRFGVCREYLKNGATTIGITPATICKIENGKVVTAYCHPEDASAMSWIAFDPARREEAGYPVSRITMLRMSARVFWCWMKISINGIGDRDWIVASVITLRWLLGMQWLILWMLALRVRQITKEIKFDKVFCVHEIWPWSRAVWYELAGQDIAGITIQHASIRRSKLWYCPASEEIEAGLKLPKEFAVFSENEKRLLQEFYSNTKFSIGCGTRYSHWKQKREDDFKAVQPTDLVLFVSSVPWWDNEVVLGGVKMLLDYDASARPIVVRLHPLAVVRPRTRKWLEQAQCKERLTLSCAALQDDITRAALVVGMNSTVLEEAAAMGRAILTLETNDYLSFATPLGLHLAESKLTWQAVEECIIENTTKRAELIRQGRQALGIDLPAVRLTI